jgi:2-iminobutanoate/2-iminopropanoate deaminase
MKTVFTENAPKPAGHYAQAIVHNDTVFVSGQLAIDPKTGEKCLGSVEEETLQVLNNLAAILKAAGSDITKVLKTTLFIADADLWGQVNAVYGDFFGDHRPARAAVPTKNLPFGFRIEIEAIAALTL